MVVAANHHFKVFAADDSFGQPLRSKNHHPPHGRCHQPLLQDLRGRRLDDGFGQPLKDVVVAHTPPLSTWTLTCTTPSSSLLLAVSPSLPPPSPTPSGVVAYHAASTSSSEPNTLEARGIVVCGTHAVVAIFANSTPPTEARSVSFNPTQSSAATGVAVTSGGSISPKPRYPPSAPDLPPQPRSASS